MANNMNKLLNKCERRLGVSVLNLPEHLTKDKWVAAICEDTLDTFSRYFPNITTIIIPTDAQRDSEGYYNIDDYTPEGVDVLGIGDIDWELFSHDGLGNQLNQGYGVYDVFNSSWGLDDAMLLQMRADHMSLYNRGLYVETKLPNKVRISTSTGASLCRNSIGIPIKIFIKHADNLMTISPTKMETFESLAIADVAKFLYSELKHYDGLDTVYATIDLKMADLETEANKREDIVDKLREGYVTAANDNQPIIFTV